MLTRRTFLTLSTATLATTLLPRCTTPEASGSQIQTFSSQDGLLDVALEAQQSTLSLGTQRAAVLTYNGQFPGPRLEARPGDTVRILLTNSLNSMTNLHYHGLHIPPTGNADNVFLAVPPGEQLRYEFTLPAHHPSGLFWYHPHHHGFVAEQVFGGLSGLFVVRGALDDIPELQAAHEEFLVLKDVELGRNGQIPQPSHMVQMWGREGSILTGNGMVLPTVTLPSQGLLRLRILNASASRFYRLAIADHPLYLIATDGGAIESPVELDEVLLAPGERAEVLIRGDRPPGNYSILNLPYDRGMMGMMRGMMGNPSFGTQPEAIATLTYGDSVEPVPLPSTLLPVESLPEPSQVRRFMLNHGMGRHMDMAFLINGQAFEHDRVDTLVQKGTVEDWEIINQDGMDHPFHIHINSFQIVSRNGIAVPYRAWKDTVMVPKQESVRIRIPFNDFAGQTVYHCHVLDHEDKGMMGLLEIAES